MQVTKTKHYIVNITAESWSGQVCENSYTFSSLPTFADVARYSGDYDLSTIEIVSAVCVETATVQSRKKVTVR